MRPADLQRYKKLLEEKQLELFAKAEPETRAPRAGAWEGDLVDKANATAEAELQARLHQSGGRLLRAIEDALARIRRGTYGVCANLRAADLEGAP
jgi:DnaK suppressor protein